MRHPHRSGRGACYFASITNLRQWIAFVLRGIGMLVGGILVFGTVGNAFALCMAPDWTPGMKAVNCNSNEIADNSSILFFESTEQDELE